MNKDEKEIIISFCVPSYNRAYFTELIVKGILIYPGDDIEVIVQDNAPTDDTVERLKKIDDKRLRVNVDKTTLSGPANWIKSLRHSRGKYSFVAFSRDFILPYAIPDLVEFLRDNDYAVVYCGEGSDRADEEPVVYKQGAEALGWAYNYYHPTGFIYRTDFLDEALKKYKTDSEIDKMRIYPHNILAADLAIRGDFACYGMKVRVYDFPYYLKSTISTVAPVNTREKFWFSPEETLKQFDKYMYHLKSLGTSDSVNKSILLGLYKVVSVRSTWWYRNVAKIETHCHHYGIEPHHVTNRELIKCAVYARDGFREITKKYGLPLSRECKRAMRFPGAKMALELYKNVNLFKEVIKKILGPKGTRFVKKLLRRGA